MESFNCVEREIADKIEEIKSKFLYGIQGKNPVIFGAGNCGHKIYDLLHGYGIEASCFCDNKLCGNIDTETGIKIVNPQELKATIDNTIILVSVDGQNVGGPIYEQLLSLGFDKEQIRIMNEYFHWMPFEYLKSNIEKYRKAYQLMDDEFSKRVYLEKMKNVFLLSDIADIVSSSEEEYFDKNVVLTEDEVFIDCGGFDGDSAMRFVEQCGGKYRDIIIFEPESCKKEAIQNNMDDNRYILYQAGVWSTNTKLHFNAMGTVSSYISERGEYTIEAVALDETVYDKKPTYIKMDVEGAEQEALKGCRKIIQEYKPKLAICIYHKPEDLFEIPAMIKEMNPEYKLYVRQYVNAWFDTVLYAI